MKTYFLKRGTRGTVKLISIALLAAGIFAGQASAAGIANSKHDMSSGSTGGNKFSGTGELCVFCHTPHGADATASVPLWNRTMSLPASYTSYSTLGTSSLRGVTAPVGSTSIACLSCHDGATAVNSVINAPGSGLTNATYTGGTWTGNLTLGKIAGAATKIGPDLRSDHPIGIQYGGGPIAAAVPAVGTPYTAALMRNADFQTAVSATINGQPVWWVDTVGGTAAREKTDMLLYTRSGVAGGATNPEPYVECASCHDAHNPTNGTFLRSTNTGSALCLACHVK